MATPVVSAQVGAVTGARSVRLEVREGDITQADTQAITNAANNHLWMGSGVAGAIKAAGGAEIEAEALAQGPIPVGRAVATGAGRLRYRAVLHGAVMGQDLRTSADLVLRTTRACLELAESLDLESLALPAFGTGVGGLDLEVGAHAMLAAATEFAGHEPRTLHRVVFVLYGAPAYRAFAEELATISGERGTR